MSSVQMIPAQIPFNVKSRSPGLEPTGHAPCRSARRLDLGRSRLLGTSWPGRACPGRRCRCWRVTKPAGGFRTGQRPLTNVDRMTARRVSPIAMRPGEGLLTGPTAAVGRRQRFHGRYCRTATSSQTLDNFRLSRPHRPRPPGLRFRRGGGIKSSCKRAFTASQRQWCAQNPSLSAAGGRVR